MVDKESFKLTDEQKEKKIQMLNEMKIELENLKYKKDHSKSINFQIHMLRILKVLLYISKKLYPYLTTAVFTFFILRQLHCTPFMEDVYEKKLEIKKEFDSLGNIRYEEQYAEFSDKESKVQSFSKWHLVDDGYYERDINVYYVKKLSLEKIEKIVMKNKISLYSLFGEPDLVKTERRNNLTREEIDSPPFLQAVIYSTSSDDIIVVKNNKHGEYSDDILWILINFLLDYLICKFKPASDDDVIWYTRRIRRKHPTIDIKELEKIYEIKRDNYNRMVK